MLKRLAVVALCLAVFALGAVSAAEQHHAFLPVVERVAKPGEPTTTPTRPPGPITVTPTPPIPTDTHGPPTNTPTPTPTP
jgi:hypothetical protein